MRIHEFSVCKSLRPSHHPHLSRPLCLSAKLKPNPYFCLNSISSFFCFVIPAPWFPDFRAMALKLGLFSQYYFTLFFSSRDLGRANSHSIVSQHIFIKCFMPVSSLRAIKRIFTFRRSRRVIVRRVSCHQSSFHWIFSTLKKIIFHVFVFFGFFQVFSL